MKRRALLRYLRKQGCELLREGKRQAIYWNPANGQVAPIPRHTEIADLLSRKICEEFGHPHARATA